jgi:SAM-dependent methyltransferase
MVLLKCSRCGRHPLHADAPELRCDCGARYPIVGGVARFVDAEAYSGSFGFQWTRFARTQLDSANLTHLSRDTFVEKTGWALDDLRGQCVLDAGCGMGRFAEIAAEAGADVHGVDLSRAVDAAAANLGHRPNVRIYQADILNLPFVPGSFDRIYSIGVLHHTPDTRRAFMALVPLLKPGGHLSVWVYTARLRTTMAASELWRGVTSRLPQRLLYYLSAVAIPLYHVHRIPLVGWASRVVLPTTMDPRPDWRWAGTFDWYSPKYQWKHTADEVRQWFAEAGLTDVRVGPFPVSVWGTRRPPL